MYNKDNIDHEVDYLIMVEGEIDCMTLYQLGYKNVVSLPNGAKGLTWLDNEIEFLKNFKKIYILMDNDEAGQEGAKKLAEKINELIGKSKCYNVVIPKEYGKDPNDVLQKYGEEKAKEIIENCFKNATSLDKAVLYKEEKQKELERLKFPESVYPETGIIADFIKYADEITEAPKEYLLAAGVMLISAVAQDRVYILEADTKLKPNIYMILVGASSDTKKTTVVNMVKGILQEVEENIEITTGSTDIDNKLLFPSQITPEAFYSLCGGKFLKDPNDRKKSNNDNDNNETKYIKQTRGLMIYSEFGELTAYLKKDYNAGFKEILTSAYDGLQKVSIATKKDGLIEVEVNYLSILSASTPAWIDGNLGNREISSGFLARFLMVFATPSDKVYPFRKEGDNKLKDSIIKKLINLRKTFKTPQKVIFSPEAKKLYEDWYRKDKIKSIGIDEDLSPFYSRHRDYVKKIAVVYQLSEDSTEYVTKENMQRAINFIEMGKKQTAYLVKSELFKTKEARLQDEIIDFIAQRSKCTKTELYRRFQRQGANRINKILSALEEAGIIKVIKEDTKGRTRTFYTLA